MIFYLQRKTQWFDDNFLCIADENGKKLYEFKPSTLLVKTIRILDANKREVAVVKQELKSLMPKYHVFVQDEERVTVKKLFHPLLLKYVLEGMGWEIQPGPMRHHYEISKHGRPVVTVSNHARNGKPGCMIEVADDTDVLTVLATVVAIDYGIEGESLKMLDEKN